MPRAPIMLSPHQKGEVETLAALLSQDQIADYLGVCRNTFRAICERDPDVGERYKRGKAKAIAHVANGLLQKARSGCTTSSIFYLKTQAGWRETAAIEHSGSTSIEHKGKASDTLKQLLDQVAERKKQIGVPDTIEAEAAAPSSQGQRSDAGP